jgi:acyl-CoA synthetase (AMP-forming)/AMP-acid ligase II
MATQGMRLFVPLLFLVFTSILVPATARSVVEQKATFLAPGSDSKLQPNGGSLAVTAGKQPSEAAIKRVVPLPRQNFSRQIFPYAPGIQTQQGKATRLLVSREVALSDPVLKAAVAAKEIPTWFRGLLAFLVLGSLLLVFVMALKEESTEGDKENANTDSVSAVAEKVSIGPSLPALQKVVAENGNCYTLIKAVAEGTPRKAAIVDAEGNVELTYADLMFHVEALATALRNAGLNKGEIVCTILQPAAPLVVATLGIFGARCVWAPLDGDTPKDWRQGQLEHMGARLQLVSEEQCSKFHNENLYAPVWCLNAKGTVVPHASGQIQGLAMPPATRHVPGDHTNPGTDPSLIIHTSGSTGRPKAVLYGHPMTLHSVLTFKELCNMGPDTVQILKTPSTWAVTEFELWPALVAGGTLVSDARCQRNFAQLARVLLQRKVDVLVTSSPVLRLLIDDFWTSDAEGVGGRPKSLKHVLNVGAGIPLDVCKDVCNTLGNGVRVHNSYAATETTTTVWSFCPEHAEGKSTWNKGTLAPGGRPDFEVEVYLVDPELNEVGPGEAGEICIAGMYLATGYLGDEEQTNIKFLKNKFGKGRMYRTGDVGRWVPDPVDPSKSVIQVTGRVDRQTNIRGMRVAPEDVESVIRKVPGVAEVSVVVGKADDVTACLVACVSPTTDSKDKLEGIVKKHCEQQLPKHMRPEFVLQKAQLPKLVNGKVDMVALKQEASDVVANTENSAPDSLGLARKVGKEVINELDTMAAARGVGILPVLLFHWYYMPIAWYHPDVVTRQFPYPSVMFINIGIAMNWSMQLFVLTSAFQDRGATEQRRSGEWKGDLLVIILLLFMHRPLPWILSVMCWAGHGFSAPLSTYNIEPQTGVRWYLYFFLICRALSFGVFSPCLAALKKEGERAIALGSAAMVFLFFAIAWKAEDKTSDGRFWWEVPDACSGYPQNSSYVWLISWILPGVNEGPGSDAAYCPLLPHQTLLWYLAVYAAGWWFGKAIVRWFKVHTPSVNPLIALLGFFVVIYLFYYLEQYQIMTTEWHEPTASTWCMNYLIDMCIAAALIFMLSFAVARKWLHYCGLVFMGRYSLGTYIFHVYAFGMAGFLSADNPNALFKIPEMVDGIKLVEGAPGSSYGNPQLLVLLAYPIIFMLTLGPLFQIACVSSYNYSMKQIGIAVEKFTAKDED